MVVVGLVVGPVVDLARRAFLAAQIGLGPAVDPVELARDGQLGFPFFWVLLQKTCFFE